MNKMGKISFVVAFGWYLNGVLLNLNLLLLNKSAQESEVRKGTLYGE